MARVRYDSYIYEEPTGEARSKAVYAGTEVHVCARNGDRYVVAFDHCHLAKPIGWIWVRNVNPLFEGQFPDSLVTPTPEG